MPLPLSITKDGFVTPGQHRRQIKLKNGQLLKPLMIVTEGETDSGKSEFWLSCPGFIQAICVDRGIDSVFDNPSPPTARNPNVAIKVISIPKESAGTRTDYVEYFKQVKDAWYLALANPDSTVAVLDGDSDYYELHTLALFGKTRQIFPQVSWTDLYMQKRAQIARAYDSGKIIITTNKIKDEYEKVFNEDGTPKIDPQTKEQEQRKTGEKVAQGFRDNNYLYHLRLRHLFQPAHTRKLGGKTITVPNQWGIRITKCKHNMDLIGAELWGDDCNFKGLVQLCYPDVPLSRWGF